MAIRIKMQIVRKGTKYENYRVSIPKAIIEAHNMKDKDFTLEVKQDKIVLTSVKRK